MSVKSLRTQLFGAIAMVLVAAIALGSSTFAWFASNTTVKATGMEVRTKVSDNLLIAPVEVTATAKADENAFTTMYVKQYDALLEPVSTVDGVSYFYNLTSNTQADGEAISKLIYEAYNPADTSDFETNYNATGAIGYVDYAFNIKATNADLSSAKNISVTELKLTYGGASKTENEKAFRAAFFVNDMGVDGETASTAPTTTSLFSIVKPLGAVNFLADNAVNGTNTRTTVSKKDTALTLASVPAKGTKYIKVVVRLWLEGEDKTCRNDMFADLTDKWALDLTCELTDATGQTNIGQEYTASKIEIPLSTTPAAEATVIAGRNYYKLGTTSYYTDDTSKTALSATSRIYTVDANNKFVQDITNKVTLTTP